MNIDIVTTNNRRPLTQKKCDVVNIEPFMLADIKRAVVGETFEIKRDIDKLASKLDNIDVSIDTDAILSALSNLTPASGGGGGGGGDVVVDNTAVLEAISNANVSIISEVSCVSDVLGTTDASTGTVMTNLTSVKSTVESVSTNVGTVKSTVESVSTTVGNVKSTVENISTNVDGVKTDISNVSTAVVNAKNAIVGILGTPETGSTLLLHVDSINTKVASVGTDVCTSVAAMFPEGFIEKLNTIDSNMSRILSFISDTLIATTSINTLLGQAVVGTNDQRAFRISDVEGVSGA